MSNDGLTLNRRDVLGVMGAAAAGAAGLGSGAVARGEDKSKCQLAQVVGQSGRWTGLTVAEEVAIGLAGGYLPVIMASDGRE